MLIELIVGLQGVLLGPRFLMISQDVANVYDIEAAAVQAGAALVGFGSTASCLPNLLLE